MKEANRETLSALMDGQLSRDQVRFALRRFEADAEAGATWSRYHVARDVLQQQSVVLARTGFAERVMADIGQMDVSTAGQAASLHRRRWIRWSAGGAIAAGVAAVALMVSQPQTAMAPGGVAQTAAAPAAGSVADRAVASRAVASVAPVQATAAQVPGWLMRGGDSVLQGAQPAAATFDGANGNMLMPAAYSRRLVPYMNIHRPPTHMPAHNDGQYIVLMPVTGGPSAPSVAGRGSATLQPSPRAH